MLKTKLLGATAAAGLAVDDVFSTYLYTGNGSSQTITNGIDLAGEGGLVWTKRRSSGDWHALFDTARTINYAIYTNTTGAETLENNSISSYSSSGYSIGSGPALNSNGNTFVSWTFRKAPNFFDIVTWTGDSVVGRTISHNLGVAPGFMMVKKTNASRAWINYHRSLGGTKYLENNNANAAGTVSTVWNDTNPTSTVFTVGSNSSVNTSGDTYVGYLFAHDTQADGLIQCGSYTGNGSYAGPTVSLGWEPQWLMIKNADNTGDWWIYDNARSTANPRDKKLLANSDAAEDTSGEDVDFTATGFQPVEIASGINTSGETYIYVAIRAEGA